MEQKQNQGGIRQISNREVKASAFTVYFSDPRNAAQLYSALSGEEVAPEDIEFTTLEGVLFVARKNDMAFTVQNRVLVISEHQSTLNPNMPLRSVIYYGRTMEKLINSKALYRNKLIPIPTPQFYVFYNGTERCPSEEILKLSDSYLDKTITPMLELSIKVININLPEGHTILNQCRPLYEYSWFVQKIRDYTEAGLSRDEAITLAVKECRREGIMADFVQEHGTEAVNMLFTQFNMDDAIEVWYEEGFEDGELAGIERGELKKMVQLVCRKLAKGKTSEVIAEELEDDAGIVERICSVIRDAGGVEDVEKVCDILLEKKEK